MIPTCYRKTIGQLMGCLLLGHIQKHTLPTSKEILPLVVETFFFLETLL